MLSEEENSKGPRRFTSQVIWHHEIAAKSDGGGIVKKSCSNLMEFQRAACSVPLWVRSSSLSVLPSIRPSVRRSVRPSASSSQVPRMLLYRLPRDCGLIRRRRGIPFSLLRHQRLSPFSLLFLILSLCSFFASSIFRASEAICLLVNGLRWLSWTDYPLSRFIIISLMPRILIDLTVQLWKPHLLARVASCPDSWKPLGISHCQFSMLYTNTYYWIIQGVRNSGRRGKKQIAVMRANCLNQFYKYANIHNPTRSPLSLSLSVCSSRSFFWQAMELSCFGSGWVPTNSPRSSFNRWMDVSNSATHVFTLENTQIMYEFVVVRTTYTAVEPLMHCDKNILHLLRPV